MMFRVGDIVMLKDKVILDKMAPMYGTTIGEGYYEVANKRGRVCCIYGNRVQVKWFNSRNYYIDWGAWTLVKIKDSADV